MPRKAKELTPVQLKRLLPGRHAVGGVPGLLLQVREADPAGGRPSASRSWILQTMIAGKRRQLGLGPFPEVGLADAREKARQHRATIRDGRDPITEKRAARSAIQAAAAAAVTFRKVAEDYIAAHEKEWRNPKHGAQWTATIESHANPIIGNMIVGDIDTQHIVQVLEPIWTTTTVTATRLRQRIETVLDAATARGYRSGPNPARWKGHLDHMLAKPSKVAKVKHHAALGIDDMHDFMIALREAEGQGAKALELAILCASRSGEVRGMTWGEVDLDSATWVIPATRMKAGREHRIPLSPAAVHLLRRQGQGKPGDLVFPGAKKGTPLSDMSLTAVLRRMNVEVTAHGFRSTFRDWASERTSYPREAAEMALAHTVESKVEAAYRRGDLFDKRRQLMSAWADFIVTPPATGAVTSIGAKRAKGAA